MKAFILKNFAGSAIRLAVLSVLILGMASVCQAQASSAPAQPTKAVAAATAPGMVASATVAPGNQGPE
jgi:Na+-transporting methylmalonyl-CoA/oxaloacetate decarboxylase gamma subunit